MRINNANELQTEISRIIFNKKGIILSIEVWIDNKQLKYRNFYETKALNSLRPGYCNSVKDDKDYKHFEKESVEELLSYLKDNEEYKNNILNKVNNHLISNTIYGENYGDLILEIVNKIEKQRMIDEYLKENKEQIKKQWLFDDLTNNLEVKEKVKRTKI